MACRAQKITLERDHRIRTIAKPVFRIIFPKGPVAQWLEPAAHNGLVAGSSPAGPTNDINELSAARRWKFCHRTSYRTRYVFLPFGVRLAPRDLVDRVRKMVWVMMPIRVQQHLE